MAGVRRLLRGRQLAGATGARQAAFSTARGGGVVYASAAMSSSSQQMRAWLQMHFCVVLWGFTGILGKLITLDALPLVWWRMSIVAGALLFVRSFWRGLRGMSGRTIAIVAGIGVLLSLHWVTFYATIRLANASVAATCMALAPVVIALLEPVIARRRFDARELLFGVAVIPGVALVAGGTPATMRLGVAMGALSAAIIGVVSCLNKRFAVQAPALSVTGIEMGAGVLFLPLLAPLLLTGPLLAPPGTADIVWLLVLAFACTLLPFALSLVALRHLSAFGSALAVNLEPVYTILLAMLLFGEQRELGLGFYAGAVILLAVVFSQPRLMRRSPAAPGARDA
jgi:drug/metabolite transporter (DMT)-like permease